MLENPTTLSIDIGTHATRAAIVWQGDIIELSSQSYELQVSDNGFIEQDAEDIVAKTMEVIRIVLSRADQKPTQAGLAIQRSTVVGWNASTGKAIYPAISWQDTRGKGEIEALKPYEAEIKSKSGLVLSAHYGASKMLWLQRYACQHYQETETVAKPIKIAPLVSFVLAHLLDNQLFICDESNAGRTQFWDIEARCWSHTLCQLFAYDIDTLPQVFPVQHEYGRLKEFDIPLTAVCGDQNAAFNCYQQNHGQEILSSAQINIGSGAFLMVPTTQNVDSGSFLKSVYRSNADGADYVLEATVNSVGVSIDQVKQRWASSNKNNMSDQNFYHLVEHWWCDFDDFPIYLNTQGGLGSPFWVSALSSEIIGDTYCLEQEIIAVIESTLFLMAINLRELNNHLRAQSSSQRLAQLFVSGGVTRIKGYCQALADICRCPIVVEPQSESSLLGVSLLANRQPIGKTIYSAENDLKKTRFLPRKTLYLDNRFKRFEAALKAKIPCN